jgi:hypothetical protein
MLSVGRGKYFKTACSKTLQVSSASTECLRSVFIAVLLHANGGDDVEGNE